MADKYAFQTITVPGTTGSVIIGGINDFGGLSGSQTQGYPNDPYPQAWVDTNGTAVVYGAGGMPYGQHSLGEGLNNLGQTVGSSGHYAQTARGYLYAGGSFTKISGPQDGYYTSAFGINDKGQVVGEMAPNGLVAGIGPAPAEAYVWQDGAITQMFSYPGASSTAATGINDAGKVVGHYSDGTNDHGFLEVKGRFTAIDVPGAVSTDPAAINNRNAIAGTDFDGQHYHGFIDKGGKMTFINAAGATDTWVTAENDFGQIAGYYETTDGAIHDFVATPGNGKDLASLAAGDPLQTVVRGLVGASTGHAFFDPSQAVTVVPMSHA